MFAEPLTEWLTEMPADELATKMTGGVTVQELPDEIRSAIGPALGNTDFVLPPLPNNSSRVTRAPRSMAGSC
jgi:arginine deiminase